jgi:class 3 adenylate cyclase
MRLLSNAAWARRKAAARDDTAGFLQRAAVLLGITRARLPLAVALSLAFGLMLVATLGAVLGLAFYAGTANTRQLLADKTNLLLDTLEGRVELLLEPVGEQLRAVADEIGAGELEPERMATRQRPFRSILASTPQLVGMAFVRPDFLAFRFRRGEGALPPEDWSGLEPIRAAFAHAGGGEVVWGPPAWSDNLRQTVINAHVPVRRDGRLLGLLFAAVTLETIVRHVDEISAGIGQPVFVLQGRDFVVALPGLDTSVVGPNHPLPLLPETGDPVLAAMWAGAETPLTVLAGSLRGTIRRVEANDAPWIVLYREIAGFGDQPWVVGTYLPASVAGAELRRLWRALLLSVGCLAAAVAATFWLGRRMARPVEDLVQAAAHIQALDLEAVPLLPRSHVRELDRAARAFNAMRNGLAWFEIYVPRRLVRQLMDNPSPEAVASRQLEVTVLFTDIVGFSRLAEQLEASEAALLLNRHFELLAGCVAETDGTVDKFLGDGMMAFWGAPLPQPDHALRAVRTALLIRDRLQAAQDGFPPLRLRLGIHTGTALVGNIGSRDRLNYTLVGDTVNIAQRLEQLGKEVAPGDGIVILASDATAAHAEGLCRVEPLGPRQLRGRDETVEVFRLR